VEIESPDIRGYDDHLDEPDEGGFVVESSLGAVGGLEDDSDPWGRPRTPLSLGRQGSVGSSRGRVKVVVPQHRQPVRASRGHPHPQDYDDEDDLYHG